MKYIIMCGSTWGDWRDTRHTQDINGEPLVARTIRQLREHGVEDIAISSERPEFDKFGVPVLVHNNTYGRGGYWFEAFYPMDEPVCYMFGDVIFSNAAIKTIVDTPTDSIEFFASAPPFDKRFSKDSAEPFALKVVDNDLLRKSIDTCRNLAEKKMFNRPPIMWELWQVIKGTPINVIDYTNYTVINDWTCDCDFEHEFKPMMDIVKLEENALKFSIIIPYYNAKPYTDELLDCLASQVDENVEVILIDDGSKEPYKTDHKWCKVYRQKNKGVSSARNKGLDIATGDYIAFIDSDDLVSKDYIQKIKDKIPFDYCDLSWKSLPGGQQFEKRLTNDKDRLNNPSAVTRVFNRAAIGNTRFNEQKQAAEDAEFTMAVCRPDANVKVITEYVYFYRTATPNSLIKRYLSGELETKRIIYHYDFITAERLDLLEEIKRENKKHEIYVLTNYCELPELSQYAKVMRPCKVRGMELRGEPWPQFVKIVPPMVFDIAIYTSQKEINGIFTWIYSFCRNMRDKYNYSIAVIHEGMKPEMIAKLSAAASLIKNGPQIKCRTLLMMKIADKIPSTIIYNHSIQILHAPRLSDLWVIPDDRDEVVPVSEVVRRSWDLKAEPIHNLTVKDTHVLSLISATRVTTEEKGLNRMRQMCRMLNDAHINYEWDLYGDRDPCIQGITYKGQTLDIRKKIRAADYLLQLSDAEGFCYSIVEALEEGTPIISTPIEILEGLNVKDKIHGHIIPFDMNFDINIIKDIPQVKFIYNNTTSLRAWKKKLGPATGKDMAIIQCIQQYKDMQLDRYVREGEIITVNHQRAEEIINAGYARRL